MDLNNKVDVEFLDMTGVAEQERQLLHSLLLHTVKPAVTLPWPCPQVAPKSPTVSNGVAAQNGDTPRSYASLFQKTKKTTLTPTITPEVNGASPKTPPVIDTTTTCPIRHPQRNTFMVDPAAYRIGEFLADYTLNAQPRSLQPRGLINRSNYCYINSILQALLACPPIYNLLSDLGRTLNPNGDRKTTTPFISAMCRFVREFQHLPASMRVGRRSDPAQKKEQNVVIVSDPPFEPTWIYKMLNGLRSDSFLIEGRQEDAEEFLGCVLNGLNDEILELMKIVKNNTPQEETLQNTYEEIEGDKEWQVMGPKNKGSVTRRTDFGQTPISDIFGGLYKLRIHRSGTHYTDNIQPFFTLQLNIEKAKTVQEALEALVSKNPIEGMISQTNEEVEAWQQMTLEELPVVLILHLKCFDFKQDGCTKIMKALDFPIDLKINSKWMSSKINNQKEKMYKLLAVVYHDGKETTKGHYLTDAFHVGYNSWLRYDDSSIKVVQEENVLKPQGSSVPYLLFYRRRSP